MGEVGSLTQTRTQGKEVTWCRSAAELEAERVCLSADLELLCCLLLQSKRRPAPLAPGARGTGSRRTESLCLN